MHVKRVVVVVALLVWFQSGATATGPANDAGSGTDAGNTMAQALQLPSFGTYSGALDVVGDADWYKASSSSWNAPLCIEADAAGNVAADMTLAAVWGSTTRSITTTLTPAQESHLGIAFPAVNGAFLGFEPPTDSPGLPGPYDFSLTANRVGDLGPPDGGSGRDAGSTLATAVPITRSCIGGILWPSHGDTADHFTFEASVGDRLVLSLGAATSAPVRLDLVSPDGTTVESAGPGGIIDTLVLEDGTWTLAAVDTLGGVVGYLIGYTEPEPDPNPCRPSCAR